MRVIETGDLQPLVDILAPDVVALGDGGGIKRATPRPIAGAAKVARLLQAGLLTAGGRMSAEMASVNGWPALILRLDGELDSVLSLRVEEGLITAMYTVRNPDKLSRMTSESTLAR